MEFDGTKGVMRPAGTKLWPLIAVTIRVIGLQLATVGPLKALAGSWTSIFLLRRRLLSSMDLVFVTSERQMPEPSRGPIEVANR